MKIYLHVGYHRTGTTYMQKTVLPALVPDGYKVYATDTVMARKLSDYLLGRNELECLQAIIREIKGIAFADKTARLVISNENIFGNINPLSPGYDNAKRLSLLFPSANVLLSIRSQSSMLPSWYIYTYSRTGSMSYKQFIDAAIQGKRFDYMAAYESIVEYFGKSKCSILIFEQLKNNRRQYVRNFLTAMSVCDPDVILARCDLESDSDVNRSPSRYILMGRILSNRFIGIEKISHQDRWKITGARAVLKNLVMFPFRVGDYLSRKFGIATSPAANSLPNCEENIRKGYGSQNRRLADAAGLPLSYFGYPVSNKYDEESS